MRDINDFIAEKINEELKIMGSSSGELAIAMNVSPLTAKRLLIREIYDFKIAQLYGYCKYFKKSLDELVGLNCDAKTYYNIKNELAYKIDRLHDFIMFDDSMEPTIKRGDHLAINGDYRDFKPYLYLIKDYNGEKIRRLSKDKHGNLIVKADNDNHETYTYSEEEQKEYIEIKGIVVYKITEFI